MPSNIIVKLPPTTLNAASEPHTVAHADVGSPCGAQVSPPLLPCALSLQATRGRQHSPRVQQPCTPADATAARSCAGGARHGRRAPRQIAPGRANRWGRKCRAGEAAAPPRARRSTERKLLG
eukprot:scaffold1916_cov123-Isochrysis_galbana.AAC.14